MNVAATLTSVSLKTFAKFILFTKIFLVYTHLRKLPCNWSSQLECTANLRVRAVIFLFLHTADVHLN